MKWIAISGSWRKVSKQVEEDVRKKVRQIITAGDGIVSGGALNVDYFAADEAVKLNPDCRQIKILLPVTLDLYAAHYRKRALEGVITPKQAEDLITQLTHLKNTNPVSLIENTQHAVVDKTTYYERNMEVIKAAGELLAFQVNESEGVQDTIEKAKQKGIPVKVYSYQIE